MTNGQQHATKPAPQSPPQLEKCDATRRRRRPNATHAQQEVARNGHGHRDGARGSASASAVHTGPGRRVTKPDTDGREQVFVDLRRRFFVVRDIIGSLCDMSEWKPIETAPKEPLNFLGEGPQIILLGGFRNEDGGPSVRTGSWKAARTNTWVDTALGRCPMVPTHWMHLPKPPKDYAP